MSEAVRSAAMTREQLAVLKKSEWFAALEGALQPAVLASSRVMVLAAGKCVFHRGDPSDGIYCVLSGAVRFGAIAASGKEMGVAVVEAAGGVGEIALFDGGVRTHDAWADVTSTVLHLPLRHLTRILAGDPGAWQHLGQLLARKLRVALALLEDMALESPRVRLARCLINLFEGYGQRKAEPPDRGRMSQGRLGVCLRTLFEGYGQRRAEPPYRVRMSQERLGMMLSLTRQTVNELLR